jgi:deoxyribodipyrimidine photolyase
MVKTGVHWFRNDLRIHDNPALMACLEQVERFIPIYIFDNKTSGKKKNINLYLFNILKSQNTLI